MLTSPATDVAIGKLISAKAATVSLNLAVTKFTLGAMMLGGGGLVLWGVGYGLYRVCKR